MHQLVSKLEERKQQALRYGERVYPYRELLSLRRENISVKVYQRKDNKPVEVDSERFYPIKSFRLSPTSTPYFFVISNDTPIKDRLMASLR